MMKKLLVLSIICAFLLSCTNNNKKDVTDNKIALKTDITNVVKLTDTLVIYESTCRGCKYETTTSFGISDSMNMIELASIVTTDDNPTDMNGGNISKDLILVPVKTGITNIKLYKFLTLDKTAADSAHFTSYKIEVK